MQLTLSIAQKLLHQENWVSPPARVHVAYELNKRTCYSNWTSPQTCSLTQLRFLHSRQLESECTASTTPLILCSSITCVLFFHPSETSSRMIKSKSFLLSADNGLQFEITKISQEHCALSTVTQHFHLAQLGLGLQSQPPRKRVFGKTQHEPNSGIKSFYPQVLTSTYYFSNLSVDRKCLHRVGDNIVCTQLFSPI